MTAGQRTIDVFVEYPKGVDAIDQDDLHKTLQEFIPTVFTEDPERTLRGGKLHGAQDAFALIDQPTPT